MKKMLIIVAGLQLAAACHGMEFPQMKELPEHVYPFLAHLYLKNIKFSSLGISEQEKVKKFLKERNETALAIHNGQETDIQSELNRLNLCRVEIAPNFNSLIYKRSTVQGEYAMNSCVAAGALLRWNTNCYCIGQPIFPWEKEAEMKRVDLSEWIKTCEDKKYKGPEVHLLASYKLSKAVLEFIKSN